MGDQSMNCKMTLFWNTLRTQICFPVALLFLSVFAVSGSSAQEIKWYPDLQSATEAAAASNKLVLLHFTAQWCRPCKTLESFVFSNPSVQRSFDSNVIAVKIDVEQHRDLVQEYAVSTVPYDVALTATGRVVTKRKSPMDASTYNKMIADFGIIINSLASEKNPGLNQNLDEFKELLRNENPRFEGQPASFTPDAPSHPAPKPSHESAELNRKAKFISNPYIQKPQTPSPTTPQRVTNAFHNTNNSTPDASPNNFSVVPNFVPNPIPSVDNNQFAPSNAEQLVPATELEPKLEFTQTPTGNPPATASTSSHSSSLKSPFTNNFTPNTVQGELIVAGKPEASTPVDQSNTETTSFEPHSALAPQRLEPAEVSGILASEQKQQATESLNVEPTSSLDDTFSGKPSTRPSDRQITPGNYQAKITLPESPEFVPVEPANNEFQAGADVGLNRESSAKQDAVTDDSAFQRPATKAMTVANSVTPRQPTNSGVAIKPVITKSAETPSEPNFALHGKCPVTLLTESKWVDGDPQWGCVHRNRIYIFASESNLKRFQSDPDGFSPILAGYDPVIFHESGKLVDGLEEYGVFMGKSTLQRVVLFASPETRAKFQQEPRKFLDTVQQAMRSSGSDASVLKR
jgi:thiol-disulfide isomerase/thioredoxin/YHS domain-containing protein